MDNLFKLVYERVNSINGKTYRREEEFREASNGTFWSVYGRNKDGSPNEGMGYSGYADRVEFEAYWRSLQDKAFAESERNAQLEKEQDEAVADYLSRHSARVALALEGLQDKDDILKIVEEAVRYHDGLKGLDENSPSDLKSLRKQLVRAYRDSREQTRDEYPDEYRDAEEKDDFYEDHSYDIAQAFFQNF
jgi:hypothetical protein